MKIGEILKMYPEADAVEYYSFSDNTKKVHTDFVKYIDDVPSEDIEAAYYALMDEDDYNSTIQANADSVYFDEFFGIEEAKVLVIVLPCGWDKEKDPDEEVTPAKLKMAETLISLPGWDGLTDAAQLCRRYSGEELKDILEAYDIEFSGIEYADTELELTKQQEKSIMSAHDRFDKENTVRISCKFNKNTDSDILKWLQDQGSKQGAIKEAIRRMIESEKS